ncbi:MAG: hypothetical protein IH630_02600 [Thermoplasmata archaeon]|nr:hypothetical protein [Thermoplasmata archaeon]MBU1159419.1 hypothetical protein [Candidatus Thermoplasmatota archaeon]
MNDRDGMTRLDDFGIVDSAEKRFKQYVAAASKLNPRIRAAWWKDTLERDPAMLTFFRGDRV